MDSQAVDHLYRTYGPAVLRRARAILGDEDAARDLLQEVFVQVIQERGRFRGEASPMTWMYRITTNLCLNRIRDASTRGRLLRENFVPEEPSRSQQVDAKLTVGAILRRLPEHLREIAVYHYVDRMSHEEIAGIVGVSRRTVGNRLEEFRRLALEAAAPSPMEVSK